MTNTDEIISNIFESDIQTLLALQPKEDYVTSTRYILQNLNETILFSHFLIFDSDGLFVWPDLQIVSYFENSG